MSVGVHRIGGLSSLTPLASVIDLSCLDERVWRLTCRLLRASLLGSNLVAVATARPYQNPSAKKSMPYAILIGAATLFAATRFSRSHGGGSP